MSVFKNFIVFGAVCAATALSAQPYMSKGVVEGWGIFVNEANSSCFMETTTKEGLIMQMGTGGGVDMGFLALYTEGATDIRDGETGEILIKLGEQMFSAEAQGVEREGVSGGYFLGNNPLLAYDLAKSQTLVVNPEGENVFTVDLTGSMKAMEATRACQLELGG